MRGRYVHQTWQADPAIYAPPRYRRACEYDAFIPEPVAGADVALPGDVAGVVSEAEKGIADLNRAAGPEFAAVVGAYAAFLAVMAVLAVGTSIIATAFGGVLFLVSDTLIARDRFVAPVRHGKLLVIVTYHLAQFLILIGLIGSF